MSDSSKLRTYYENLNKRYPNSRLRIIVYCKDNILGNKEKDGISRGTLAAVVITSDFLICIFFLIFIFLGKRFITKEQTLL